MIFSEVLPDNREAAIQWYATKLTEAEEQGPDELHEAKRWLGRNDLFYLLIALLKRNDVNNDWLFDRCREVQADPNGNLDLWARYHYKSTIITFGLTIQDILNDPELTFGIFSHVRPIAKAFLRQIKQEFESNEELKATYPDILWQRPKTQAPKWSEDDGITVRRKSNPKEQTVEAHGLVDGQPTSTHFRVRLYDDVVTRESVTTPAQIQKTTDAWALSTALGMEGGVARYAGTRYHLFDTYAEIIKRGAAKVRYYPATDDGTIEGNPVLLSAGHLAELRRDMGIYIFAAQMLQDPTADKVQGFREEWLRYWPVHHTDGLNKYLIVDPASEKKKDSDYTAMWIVGLGEDRNYYVCDMVRDRLNLAERAGMVMALHRRWQPLAVGYEKYGLQADTEHIEYLQKEQNYRFKITNLGGAMPKGDRIRRLVPIFEANRLYLPEHLARTDWEGTSVDLVRAFRDEEYIAFPVPQHDDLLDGLARILDDDLGARWPTQLENENKRRDAYSRRARRQGGKDFMSS